MLSRGGAAVDPDFWTFCNYYDGGYGGSNVGSSGQSGTPDSLGGTPDSLGGTPDSIDSSGGASSDTFSVVSTLSVLKRYSPQASSCTAVRAALASAGSQLSQTRKTLTWGGVGIVTLSGAGAFLAPEAAPLELDGGETGASMIELGGTISHVGATLQGYGKNGVLGAAEALTLSLAVDKASNVLAGRLFPGIGGPTKSGAAAILGEIPDAIQTEEVVCGDGG